MKKAYLVLNNGRVFEGTRIGADGDGLGELVFTTGMTGYLETLTDPSYAGQIILQTFPLIGNYGVIPEDFEGPCLAKGYVVRELCDTPSNFRSEYALDAFLKEHNVPGICGVDTRALTRIIREEGVMNALICDEIPKDLSAIQTYAVLGGVKQASSTEPRVFPAEGEEKYHVALLDYGAKHQDVDTALGIADEIGYPVIVRPAYTLGGETVKLKYGHRGANQPVKDLKTGRCFITSQNHGYAVVAESVKDIAELRYINANDYSCEGLDYPEARCFTVQFHPEASAGPHDTGFLFDRFVSMMGGKSHA